MTDSERHDFDVVVIGAGGAGLRAAIEARQAGARTALVCKSLLGKAHTVMAEGGIAAALSNVWPQDNWEVHFRDTMRGGKMLNNWRMAQIHALEAPDRVLELEEWGALFDRTADGRILQRDFGGHRYARLAHVGDRTGLEMIRALQHRAVSIGVDVFMECKIVRLLQDDAGAVNGAVGFWRESGGFVTFGAKAVVIATGGLGKAWKFTTNSWECTGDGMALALWAGADLIDMEAIQFHPTGMVWPPSARGLLVTEGVRGDGGVLKDRDGERFMFNYISPFFAAETASSIEEADQWYGNKVDFRRPPELLPRDEVARAINSEVKAGRGSPHGGVFLDIASRRTPEEIRRLLPSMYHQFKQLADIDITTTPMEVGPTCHYAMGGVRVEADTEETTVTGLYCAGEAAGGMHGSNRLGGNSLSDLVVFGRRAGASAAARALAGPGRVEISEAQVSEVVRHATFYFDNEGTEDSYAVHRELQETMQDLVGIIRVETELLQAREKLIELAARASKCTVEGGPRFNPGWHLALDLESMLAVSNCTTLSAIERKESRGGHTRDDYPGFSPEFENINMVTRLVGGEYVLTKEPKPQMPDELAKLFAEEVH
ncbi:MAG: fumarate reductase/succinate dehydrogenase flavoprotein subunit [Acidimicrobiales bacterium]|jgi:succinate dehydrogenase / fumarate reductase flavoprotein subunit